MTPSHIVIRRLRFSYHRTVFRRGFFCISGMFYNDSALPLGPRCGAPQPCYTPRKKGPPINSATSIAKHPYLRANEMPGR